MKLLITEFKSGMGEWRNGGMGRMAGHDRKRGWLRLPWGVDVRYISRVAVAIVASSAGFSGHPLELRTVSFPNFPFASILWP